MRRRLRILIDNCTEKDAVTHSFVQIPQTVRWGRDILTMPVTVLGRKRHKGWKSKQVAMLPRIAQLAEANLIECFTSEALRIEDRHLESGIATETDLFRRLKVQQARVPLRRELAQCLVRGQTLEQFIETNKELLDYLYDSRFTELNRLTGGHHPADTFHLWTAEFNRLDCLLTTDKRFWNAINNSKTMKTAVRVVCPTELCQQLRRFYPLLFWRELKRHYRVATGRESRPDRGFRIID